MEETGNVFDTSDVTPSAVRVWDTDTGEPAGPPITGRGGRPMDFAERRTKTNLRRRDQPGRATHSGRHDKGLRLHDVATGQPVGEPWIADTAGGRPVVSVAFSPDGTYAVSADMRHRNCSCGTSRPVDRSATQ